MTTLSEPRLMRFERPPSVKARILASAIEEFTALGYHGSSLRSIAERSRATKPMIYYHYQGKDGLYAAVVNDQIARLEAHIRIGVAERGDAVGRLEAFARAYLESFVFDFPMLAVGLRELPTLPAPVFEEIAGAHGRMVVAQLKAILRDGIDSGELRALDVDNCCRAIIGIMHYYIRGADMDPRPTAEAAISQIVEYYAAGLLAVATDLRG
ncbi:MAG: TetR/AcrR family transcriptional regulator [Dehalococcoidia bacterium]